MFALTQGGDMSLSKTVARVDVCKIESMSPKTAMMCLQAGRQVHTLYNLAAGRWDPRQQETGNVKCMTVKRDNQNTPHA